MSLCSCGFESHPGHKRAKRVWDQGRKPTTWLSLGREGRSDARVVAEGDRRAPRGAGCEKFPSGNLLVAESHHGHQREGVGGAASSYGKKVNSSSYPFVSIPPEEKSEGGFYFRLPLGLKIMFWRLLQKMRYIGNTLDVSNL